MGAGSATPRLFQSFSVRGRCPPPFSYAECRAPWKKVTGTSRPRFSHVSGRCVLGASPLFPLPVCSLSSNTGNRLRFGRWAFELGACTTPGLIVDRWRSISVLVSQMMDSRTHRRFADSTCGDSKTAKLVGLRLLHRVRRLGKLGSCRECPEKVVPAQPCSSE